MCLCYTRSMHMAGFCRDVHCVDYLQTHVGGCAQTPTYVVVRTDTHAHTHTGTHTHTGSHTHTHTL